MANEKKKNKRYTTAKSSVAFSSVTKVDHGTKEYPDEDGNYNITLRFSADELENFKAMISNEIEQAEADADEAFSKLKPAAKAKFGSLSFNTIGTEEYDKETEEPTGFYFVRFKTKARYKNKQGEMVERKIPLFNAQGQPVKVKDELGWGSIVRVSCTPVFYFVAGSGTGGLSLYLDAVQILKKEAFGGQSASSFGFGSEEDGDYYGDDDGLDTSADVDASTSSTDTHEFPF